jgi:hypothetical protein
VFLQPGEFRKLLLKLLFESHTGTYRSPNVPMDAYNGPNPDFDFNLEVDRGLPFDDPMVSNGTGMFSSAFNTPQRLKRKVFYYINISFGGADTPPPRPQNYQAKVGDPLI